MRRLAVLLTVLALISAACGTVVDVPSPVVSTELPGLDDDEALIGCPNGPWFPRTALEGTVDLASSGQEEITTALRPFLESEEGQHWPQDGWKILHSTDEVVLLVHLELPNRLSFVTVEETGGTWQWAGAQAGESCPLEVQMPEGLNTVEWRLEPGEDPRPDSTSVRLLLQERECVSGQSIGDRLVGPQIVYNTDQLLVSFAAQPPPGDAFSCQGNPETPFELKLDEPLGERELVSGRDLGVRLEELIG